MNEIDLIISTILENKDSVQYKFITSPRRDWIMEMMYPENTWSTEKEDLVSFLKKVHEDGKEEELGKIIKGLVRQRMVPEAIPYLVKGKDAQTGEWVIGFPYVFMKEAENGEMSYCNLIFSPFIETEDSAVDPEIPDKYGFAIGRNELHFIEGKLYKWVGCDEAGVNYFEDRDEE